MSFQLSIGPLDVFIIALYLVIVVTLGCWAG
jgi:hypothetical protein